MVHDGNAVASNTASCEGLLVLVRLELNDGIIDVHLFAIAESNDEAAWELISYLSAQTGNLVVVGRSSDSVFKYPAFLVVVHVRLVLEA